MVTWTWAEPFAGAAACALRLVGGKDLAPPVAWMGGKRRLARAIVDAMGVPDSPPARVLLADAGPWGWVWPLLLAPSSAAEVARILRSWAGEHPRELWQRLAAQPPAEDLHERAAQWLWLQARSASGVPIWWDGWRLEAGNGKAPTDRGEDMRWPSHRAERGRWEAMSGRGSPQRPGFNTGQVKRDGWRAADHATGRDSAAGQSGRGEGRVQDATNGQRGSWRFDARPCDASPDRLAGPSGDKSARTGGMVNPATIAARAEAFARAFADVDVQVHHGDSRAHADAHGLPRRPWWSGREECDCVDCDGTWCAWCLEHHGRRPCPVEEEAKASAPRVLLGATYVYLDPPYLNATGYGWDMPRADVLELARRWADAGAVVAVSEAEPLALEGWHHLELTRPGGKAEWLTLSRPPARFPARQASLFSEEPDAA